MHKLKYWFIPLFFSHSVYALTTLTVTLDTDNNPGGMGDPGDLRYFINTMNLQLSTTEDDYAILFDHPMTIQLNGILPIINNSSNRVNITIGNSGSTPTVTIDGNSGAYSGFFIPMGNVTIQNMIFQNLTAKGGDGGDGISGGGGGLGAGGAIYVPQPFLNGSNPSVTLMNVLINNCAAVGGNGGNYFNISSPTGNEGGAGGGGFSGNGGSITTTGTTGGAGGGGFGGNGGDVTLSLDLSGGGGGGGGGLGSRATLGSLTNLGNGGSDVDIGQAGNGLGLSFTAGDGGGGNAGGINAGGGGGGGNPTLPGGGGGGSAGFPGYQPQGDTPPLPVSLVKTIQKPVIKPVKQPVSEVIRALKARFSKNAKLSRTKVNQDVVTRKMKKLAAIDIVPSGGNGGDGGGAGGGGVVITAPTNNYDGQPGTGGYGGGGGGGAGTGAYDIEYTVQGGDGGVGGGGGGGGVNQSGITSANGGDSLGGGGGGGGGPSNGPTALGGADLGNLGGGAGGAGANNYGPGLGGGGGGGGSGLGGAIFVDGGLNFTIQALPGTPTTFNTPNTIVNAGLGGSAGSSGGTDGLAGTALGNSIFLRENSSLTFMAQNAGDILTLGDQVAFTDDTSFGGTGTVVFVKGNGTVIYNGTTDYQGYITVNDANFKVNGVINQASVAICRDTVSSQRGILSGIGTLTGNVLANSGTISPDTGGTLTLGSLILNSATGSSLGSLVHIDINSSGASLVATNGPATLAGILEVNLDANAVPGEYTLLTSSGITGAFDSISVTSGTGKTPTYTLSYLPEGAPTYVQLDFTGFASSVDIPATLNGSPVLSPAVVCCGRPIILGPLPVPGSGPTVYSITNQTGNVTCQIGQTNTQTYLKMQGNNGSCTIVGTKDGVTSNPLTVIAS